MKTKTTYTVTSNFRNGYKSFNFTKLSDAKKMKAELKKQGLFLGITVATFDENDELINDYILA